MILFAHVYQGDNKLAETNKITGAVSRSIFRKKLGVSKLAVHIKYVNYSLIMKTREAIIIVIIIANIY